MLLKIIVAIFAMVMFQVSVAHAEERKIEPVKPKSESASGAPAVTNVQRIDCKGPDCNTAGLGHAIRVKIDNLKMFIDAAKSHNKKIHLFMDGKEIKGITPNGGLYGDNKDELQFRLLRREALPVDTSDAQQKAVWSSLFGFQDNLHRTRDVTVSVGEEGDIPIPSNAPLKLIRIRTGWAVFYIFIMIALVCLYIWAYKKGAFSGRGDDDDAGTAKGSKTPALSLALVQMVFWFFFTVASFFFIWVVIGELPEVPVSVLALIGIASGTALGAAAIDTNKRSAAKAGLQKLEDDLSTKKNDRDALLAQIRSFRANDTKRVDMTRQISDIEKNIAILVQNIKETRTQISTVMSCGSPIYDLLADANGISFHRLQMAVWTLVLGIVFVVKVAINLSLPEFDMTLLALMGISSGTYLGFKFPEQQQKC
jgi:hypothetical protein